MIGRRNKTATLWTGSPDELTDRLQELVSPSQPTDPCQRSAAQARRRVVELAVGTAAHDGAPIRAPRSARQFYARLRTTSALKALYPTDTAIRAEIDELDQTTPPILPNVAARLSVLL